MSNRAVAFGQLFRADRDAAREVLREALRDARGKVVSAAHLLGVDRRTLFRYLWRENLWPELDAIRAEQYEPEEESWTRI